MAEGADIAGRIPFNRKVFRWARDRIRCDIEDAAKAINVTPDRLSEWEAGTRWPTVKQARRLADLYDRPFLEFFSKDIPNVPDTTLAPDFRLYRGAPPDMETVALKELQRWAEEQRLNALDLLEILGEEPPRFPEELYTSTEERPEAAAHRARTVLGFSIESQLALKSKERVQLPNILRTKFERVGVLVLRQNGLQKLRTRGICLFADPLPIILYGGEAPSAQAFTLAHEFAHILLQQSAISGQPRLGGTSGIKAIEDWCNRFAAAFLMPEASVGTDMGDVQGLADSISDDRLSWLATRYAVSRHAMLIRLVTLGYVKPAFYWFVKRPEFLKEEAAYRSMARPKYYGSRYRNSRGDFYTGLVLEAWNGGRITNHNAAEFMGIKSLSHLNDIRAHFGD
jgi:Zn-dependent peptidase ImmA (M78 family)